MNQICEILGLINRGGSLMDKVELAKKGDNQAFNDLIEENKFKIYKTAKSILGNEDDVCDAIQNALISTYKTCND